MAGYLGNPISDTLIQETKKEIFEFLATAGQTVFSGNDINGFTLEYAAGLTLIALNGSWLDAVEYTATDGTSITLTTPANVDQSLKVLVFDSFDVINTYNKFQADQKYLTSDPATARGLLDVQTTSESATVSARNKVINQDPLSQGESTRSGMSSTIYTGNGTSQSIATGVDMATGDFGGLVWIKGRSSAYNHFLFDTIRGVHNYLRSDVTSIEGVETNTVTSFDSTGFSTGNHAGTNENTTTQVAWSFQTTKKTTGLTNRNKAYTCHYNPDMNFSIVGYEGDGVDGHEIPHHLGVVPELSIIKDRDSATQWMVRSNMFGNNDNVLQLNQTIALTSSANNTIWSGNNNVQLGSAGEINNSTKNHIMYNFASKSGVCKIGKYIGTGAAGNYVSTEVDGDDAFKPSFVMVKDLTGAFSWLIVDGIRGDNDLYPNLSNAESSANNFDFIDNGFSLNLADPESNTLNHEYIFMAFAETSIDANKAIANYDYATTPDTLSIANETLISVANGFNANGQVDTQFQFGSGITESYGVGHEDKQYYIYSDKTGTLGVSEIRPLSGITRKDADKYGEVSPTDALVINNNSRTTSKHFDYESDSGVCLANEESVSYESWRAFDKNVGGASKWLTTTLTNVWVQYKQNEKRILKSWRLRDTEDVTDYSPKRFIIEGSNDGLNWTTIDSTYSSVDYVRNGTSLWSELHSTSANTTAYTYHRIYVTSGRIGYVQIAELEFNTVLETDYYLIEEGKSYSSSDIAQERMYLGEFKTDSTGDVIKDSIINYAVAEQEISSVKVHNDLTVYGDINHESAITAECRFDMTTNPPLMTYSNNILDIVDNGAGTKTLIFETPMDNLDYRVQCTTTTWGNPAAWLQTLNSCNVGSVNSAEVGVDVSDFSVTIYGGKKIL